MPNWVSRDGVCFPAKEYAVLPHLAGTGREIYNGPDRAALKHLWDIDKSGKTTTIGEDFRKNPDFQQMIRTRGFKDVEEYLTFVGYDKEQNDKDFKEKASVVKMHELPKRIEEIERLGGGTDMSGSNVSYVGGFGDSQIKEATK